MASGAQRGRPGAAEEEGARSAGPLPPEARRASSFWKAEEVSSGWRGGGDFFGRLASKRQRQGEKEERRSRGVDDEKGGRRRKSVCDASSLSFSFSLSLSLSFSRLPALSPSFDESLEVPASSPPSPAARSTERTGRRCCCCFELSRRGERAERSVGGGDNVIGRIPRFAGKIGAAREEDATGNAAATATRGANARAGIIVVGKCEGAGKKTRLDF